MKLITLNQCKTTVFRQMKFHSRVCDILSSSRKLEFDKILTAGFVNFFQVIYISYKKVVMQFGVFSKLLRFIQRSYTSKFLLTPTTDGIRGQKTHFKRTLERRKKCQIVTFLHEKGCLNIVSSGSSVTCS